MKTTKYFIMIIAIILIIMVITPLEAQFSGGEGTDENPWRISTVQDLVSINNPDYLNDHFLQINNIDLAQVANWQPIGEGSTDWDDTIFLGTYDGGGHTIDNLTINRPDPIWNREAVGLFGVTHRHAVIKNLGLNNVNITGGFATGALAGRVIMESQVINCWVSGGSVTGNGGTGGLIGFHDTQGQPNLIEDCRTDVEVIDTGNHTGGLVGRANGSTINRCYSVGPVSGTRSVGGLVGDFSAWTEQAAITNSYSSSVVVNTGLQTGGFIGVANVNRGSIHNCYATGNVSGESHWAAGFVGQIQTYQDTGDRAFLYNCYSTGLVECGGTNPGGFAGRSLIDTGYVESCYWNIETSGMEESPAGGEGRTTDQMVYPYAENTYVEWDFEEIWTYDETREINNGYPYLSWQEFPVDIESPVVTISFIGNELHLNWEEIADAVSYIVYTSDNLRRDLADWEELARTQENRYSEPLNPEIFFRFFFVKSSLE